MNTTSYWSEGIPSGSYPPLGEDLTVDFLVIGGGITGLTAAYALAREGKSVALVERDSIGSGDTSQTTAHLTYMTDTRLSDLVSTFGRDGAKAAWQGGAEAMRWIQERVKEHSIDCELTTLPGFLVAAGPDLAEERSLLQQEAQTASQMGFEVAYLEEAPPAGRPGIRFPSQLKFHPLKYLQGLAQAAVAAGVKIFEQTEATEFHEQPLAVRAGDHLITAGDIFIATHVPLQGIRGTMSAALFQTKLSSYSTYAVGGKIPVGTLKEMLWSDTADPFNYLRVDRHDDYDFAIYGGEDHKTGQEPRTEERFRQLERRLTRLVPEVQLTHRWSGQVVETVDGLPYIGRNETGQFIATGFSGNGMTFGTLAGLMVRDAILGRSNPWQELFDPDRKRVAALGAYLKENADFPIRMITDRLKVHHGDPADLQPGHAQVLCKGHRSIAAYRDKDGSLHCLDAVCPHLGCIVAWNGAERTWDCPCHGSRFEVDGTLIAGPAEEGLAILDPDNAYEPAVQRTES